MRCLPRVMSALFAIVIVAFKKKLRIGNADNIIGSNCRHLTK